MQLPKHYIQYLLFSLEAKIVSDVFIFHKKTLQSFLSGNETFQKKRFIFVTFCKISYFGFVLIDKSLLRSVYFFKQILKSSHAKFLRESVNCLAPGLF